MYTLDLSIYNIIDWYYLSLHMFLTASSTAGLKDGDAVVSVATASCRDQEEETKQLNMSELTRD